jgi:hypothetical protein
VCRKTGSLWSQLCGTSAPCSIVLHALCCMLQSGSRHDGLFRNSLCFVFSGFKEARVWLAMSVWMRLHGTRIHCLKQ